MNSKICGERNVYSVVNTSRKSVNTEGKEHEEDLECGNVSLNSTESIHNDFYDFKVFTHNSLAELRSEMDVIKIADDSHKVDSTKSVNDQRYIIESKDAIIQLFREEISFLRQENIDLRDIIRRNHSNVTSQNISSNDNDIIPILVKQLNDKQKTIETLLSNQQLSNVTYERKHLAANKIVQDNNVQNTSNKPLTANKIVQENCLSINNVQNSSNTYTNVNELEKSFNRNTIKEKPVNTPPPVKNVFIVGDSIVNGVNPNRFKDCKNLNISVKPFGGSTSRDMLDYIKPIVRKRPDILVVHVGTNDLTNSVDTIENLSKLFKYIHDESPETNIAMSSVTTRTDRKGLDNKVTTLNINIAKLCSENELKLIDHSNITSKHLSKKKLHLDTNGLSILSNNFVKFINNCD